MSVFLWISLVLYVLDVLSRAILLCLMSYPRQQKVPAWIDVVQVILSLGMGAAAIALLAASK